MNKHATAHRILPHSRPAALAKLDQRTKEARLVRETRAELTAHVGGSPSATQAALIEQLVQIKLRLAVMDRRFAEAGAHTDHDSRQYLAWANSYARLLRQLGMQGAPPGKPATLADYLRARGSQDGATGAAANAPHRSPAQAPPPAQRPATAAAEA